MKIFSFNFIVSFAVIILLIVCCATPERLELRDYYTNTNKRSGEFTIRKMFICDSMYIIYAQMGDSIYKIYSRQEIEQLRGGIKLCVDSTYYLYLRPLYNDYFHDKEDFDKNFKGRWIEFKKKTRQYCVDNIFTAVNIRDDKVYKRGFRYIWDSRYVKYLEEPYMELPTEWDSIPEKRVMGIK